MTEPTVAPGSLAPVGEGIAEQHARTLHEFLRKFHELDRAAEDLLFDSLNDRTALPGECGPSLEIASEFEMRWRDLDRTLAEGERDLREFNARLIREAEHQRELAYTDDIPHPTSSHDSLSTNGGGKAA